MSNVNKRLDDLENRAVKNEGLAVYFEERPTAKIVFPRSRRYEPITVDDFRAEFPGGTLIIVQRVSSNK